jgi:hypothetical protein
LEVISSGLLRTSANLAALHSGGEENLAPGSALSSLEDEIETCQPLIATVSHQHGIVSENNAIT